MSADPAIGAFDALPGDEPHPGVRRASFSSKEATVTRYRFAPGARFPIHRHPQEQITLIERGEVEMTVAGEPRTLEAGAWVVVAPDVEHGITAGEAGAEVVAVVVPRRESPDAYEVVR